MSHRTKESRKKLTMDRRLKLISWECLPRPHPWASPPPPPEGSPGTSGFPTTSDSTVIMLNHVKILIGLEKGSP